MNYAKYIDEYFIKTPLDKIVENRNNFIEFIIDVHNDVRVRSKSEPINVEDTFKYYNKEYLSYVKKEPTVVAGGEKASKSIDKSINDSLEEFTNPTKMVKSLLYQFNPIMVLIGIVIGLIIYKLFQESIINRD